MTFNLFNLIYFVSGGGPLRQTEIMVTTAFRLVNQQPFVWHGSRL